MDFIQAQVRGILIGIFMFKDFGKELKTLRTLFHGYIFEQKNGNFLMIFSILNSLKKELKEDFKDVHFSWLITKHDKYVIVIFT
jgi:hypothetical protein